MWVCYDRRYVRNLPFGLELGRWYELTREIERVHSVPTAYLRAAEAEIRVPAKYLSFRETRPDYAFAHQVERMGPVEEQRLLMWMPVCPDGHQGEPTSNQPPEEFACAGCDRVYEVRLEDSALVMRSTE